MKIEIDTKHDSPEEIKKVIKMLQHLVSEHSYTNQPNIFDDSSPSVEPPTESTNAFVNMFGDTQTKKQEESTDDPKEEPMNEEKKDDDEIPEVVPY